MDMSIKKKLSQGTALHGSVSAFDPSQISYSADSLEAIMQHLNNQDSFFKTSATEPQAEIVTFVAKGKTKSQSPEEFAAALQEMIEAFTNQDGIEVAAVEQVLGAENMPTHASFIAVGNQKTGWTNIKTPSRHAIALANVTELHEGLVNLDIK